MNNNQNPQRQGQSDAASGEGPANQQNKPYQERESYNGAYTKEQNKQTGNK